MSRFSGLEFERDKKAEVEPAEARRVGEPPPDKEQFLRLARHSFLAGDFEAALRYYGRALENDRMAVEAWAGQVQMLIALGEFKEARLWANKALGFFRDNPDLLGAKAVAAVRSGSPDEAMKLSDASLVADVKSPYLWLARAEVLMARRAGGQPRCFEKALLYTADRAWAALLMAQACMYYGQHAKASEYLKTALGKMPGNFYLWFLSGECYHVLGLEGKAQECYAQALQLNPGFDRARYRLVRYKSGGLEAIVRAAARRMRHLFKR